MLPVAEIVRYWSSSSEQSAPTAWLVWWPSSSAVDDPPDTRDRIANPRSGPAPSSRTGSGGRVSWPGRSCPSSSARAVSLVTTVFPAKRQSLVERPWSASANALPADPTVALSPRPSPAAGRGSRSAVIVVAWGGGFAAPTLNRVTVTRSVLVAGSMASPAVARRTACAWVCSPG